MKKIIIMFAFLMAGCGGKSTSIDAIGNKIQVNGKNCEIFDTLIEGRTIYIVDCAGYQSTSFDYRTQCGKNQQCPYSGTTITKPVDSCSK